MDDIKNKIVENQTINWIKTVVIGNNFCPFASKPFVNNGIRFIVLTSSNLKSTLSSLASEFVFLDNNESVETTLIIFENDYTFFNDYLGLVQKAEDKLYENGYEGIYQLASFHPDYCFDGATEGDPSNYTNRSPYPMLHILREDRITKALANFENPETITDRNIEFAGKKGLKFMQAMLSRCFE